MTTLTLYHAPQSTCSQRVRFVLHAKGLAFAEHKLDLMAGDQIKPEYLKLNPGGVVPTLVHDGAVITDSTVICEYLDEVFSDCERFTPETPVARAAMRSLMRFIDEVPAAAVRVPTYNLAFLPNFQAMTEEKFLAVANAKPLRREFLLHMGRTGFPEAEMQEALGRLKRAVVRADAEIAKSGGPFLLGRSITLADIALMPAIVRMDDLGLDHTWAEHPRVAAWLEEVRAHSAYAKTYYPGSLLSEMFPHLRRPLAAAE